MSRNLYFVVGTLYVESCFIEKGLHAIIVSRPDVVDFRTAHDIVVDVDVPIVEGIENRIVARIVDEQRTLLE